MPRAARVLVDTLLANGADCGYCVPGESYLDLLDALYDVRDRFELVVCRHEAGAANMAEAYGKLTGKPGLAFVTRGPGASHASIGIHTAMQDATPVILIVGQVPRDMLGRGAFQEVDYTTMYASLAKWVVQIDDAARIPEIVGRAYAVATSGRPGPVVLAIPEDVFDDECDAPPAHATPASRARASGDDVRRLYDELVDAERPLVVVGGGPWTEAASRDLARFAQANALPVVVEFRCQDYLDNEHPCYAGELGLGIDPQLAKAVRDADVILALGARLGEIPTDGYTLLDVPYPKQRLLQVAPDPDELGRVYRPALGIVADASDALARLAHLAPTPRGAWAARTSALRDACVQRRALIPAQRGVDLGAVVETIRERLPDDAIVTNGAGNYTIWVRRHYVFRQYGTQLAPRSGAMGYGLPAAIAAKLRYPNRAVVCFAGDGCFGMSLTEFATAAMYGAAIVVIVVNNASYGTIRMHQERRFPGRPSATAFLNPDFAAFARAYGAFGERVERTEDFPGAFERAIASGKPALIEVPTDPDLLTPTFRVSS